ncbi:MAG TPA: glycosyltransferase family 4 protein [Terriglobales bacterium]|nr:glycosyltransferase family 4 protein [Terriglobales bacterium]
MAGAKADRSGAGDDVRRVKVLMLHNRYLTLGGEDVSTAADVALLKEYGHEVKLLEQDNRDIEGLGRTRTAMNTLWSSRAFHIVEKELRSGQYDVLHVQNFFPLWSPAVYYAAAKCSVPVVQTLHNYRLMCVNSFLYRNHGVCEECLGRKLPWPGVMHGCYRSSRAASATVAGMIGLHNLMRTWSTKVHGYIAVSEFARAKYITAGLPEEKIAVRPNFLHPAPEPGHGGGGYALYVGRLSPEKGIATLLKAWKAAKDPLPLKIVGEGPLRELVSAAAQADSAIEYIGARSLDEVLRLMGEAELLVFPSEWQETMGRTVMEAFAKGTPVLASALGPALSMVAPAKTGLHFQAGNVSSLCAELDWCSRNLDKVRALRNNARAWFEQNCTGPASLATLLEVYRRAGAAQARCAM